MREPVKMSDENKIRDVVDAVTGVAKAIPVYQDVVQPAAQEVGKALQTVAKTVHVALAPVSALVWGYDQIRDFVSTKVAERLRDIPAENITTPKPNVAGPALESLRYTGHESALSDMYANLLASAMNKETANGAHPAFVEIIKQLTPDEAKLVGLFSYPRALPLLNVRWEYREPQDGKSGGSEILVNYSHLGRVVGCEFPEMTPTYIDNLCRLGLAEIPTFMEYTGLGVYGPLEEDDEIKALQVQYEKDPDRKIVLDRKALRVTELGKQFAKICVVQKTIFLHTAGQVTF
jgi:Abortive infection alpha